MPLPVLMGAARDAGRCVCVGEACVGDLTVSRHHDSGHVDVPGLPSLLVGPFPRKKAALTVGASRPTENCETGGPC